MAQSFPETARLSTDTKKYTDSYDRIFSKEKEEKSELTNPKTLLKVALIAKVKQQMGHLEVDKEYIDGMIQVIADYKKDKK